MGWDYYTFEKQPPFFIEELLIFMLQENNKQNNEMKQVETPKQSKGIKRG